MINLNTGEGLNLLTFPDGQPHVNIRPGYLAEDMNISVTCSITNSVKMLQLLEVVNAIENGYGNKSRLIIPYLMGARYDRLMQPGDSVDLKVISNLINGMGFRKVVLYDVHSDVATQLIDRSVNVSNKQLVDVYHQEGSVLICPDAGAAKKINKYLEWNESFADVVQCVKHRDVQTGSIKLRVLEPEKCNGADCVIIDDICDGGRTFLTIADQIDYKSLTLIVTHGIFSNGYEELEKKFDQIITSDSYQSIFPSKIVKAIPFNQYV